MLSGMSFFPFLLIVIIIFIILDLIVLKVQECYSRKCILEKGKRSPFRSLNLRIHQFLRNEGIICEVGPVVLGMMKRDISKT